MAIAEHDPSKLRGPVPKMSQAQLHDFASGSMKGKPAHVLHPALAAHGAKVKAAHATLKAAGVIRGALKPAHMRAIQAHIRKTR